MLSQTVIVIPIYKKTPTEFEIISFKQCLKVFKRNVTIAIICYKDLDILFYEEQLKKSKSNYFIIYFDKSYFESTSGYNYLMLSLDFYRRFKTYNYILIYQLDAYVFRNELFYWTNKRYDYIGAPLPLDMMEIINHKSINDFGKDENTKLIMNGGFSMRKVNTFIEILESQKEQIKLYLQHDWNEDVIFSILLQSLKIYNLPTYNEAIKFSFESYPKETFEHNNYKLPFGCHAWYKEGGGLYNNKFWFKKIITFRYYKDVVLKRIKGSFNKYFPDKRRYD